jgi:uncharacterized protein (DUF58 family)
MRPAAGTAALGLLLALVAGTFDAEPLYVAAVAFVALAAVACGWVWLAARGVKVTRTLGARRVVEEEPLDVRVHVRTGPVGVPGGVVSDEMLPQDFDLPIGRRGRRVLVHARFARRGRRALDPPEVVIRDPFGLATRVVRGTGHDELLVLPRIEPVRPVSGGDGRDGPRKRGRPAMAAEVELDGVREHRPGTPASRIYWPALARGAGLMERRLRSEADATPLIVLDARSPEREEDLDAAVRAVASLAVSMAREGGGVGVLLPGDRRPTVLDESLGGWTHLHARLAMLPAGGYASLHSLASRVGPVLYVAARAPGRTPRALEHAPAAGRVLVVPGAIAGRRPAFTVAGCTGYDLRPARGRPATQAGVA